MTPLGAARRMVDVWPDDHADVDGCPFCHHFGHEPGCPWLQMPRIVAALEAAERLSALVETEQWHHSEDVRLTVDGKGTYSWCQECDVSWPCKWSKTLGENEALAAVLRGEA